MHSHVELSTCMPRRELSHCVTMDPSNAKKRKREHLFCPHCDSYLNDKSFRDHKRLYFSPATKKWIRKEECREADSEDDLPSLPDSRSSDSELLHQNSPPEVDSSPLSLPDQPVESLHPDHSSVEDIWSMSKVRILYLHDTCTFL